jgi:uncharacterized protein (DUF2336 family)
MSAAESLIPELEDAIRRGSPEKRVATLQRITSLFVNGASNYNEDHVSVFDDVFTWLIEEIETKARAELSSQLAPVKNAPVKVVKHLAQDDDIGVAGPLLQLSARLEETDLLEIARRKSQAHLLAISARSSIGEAVTDVLVKRGDTEVVRSVADNKKARLSDNGFSTLVKRAENDGLLAEKVGLRPDIPPRMFRELLMQATEVVQQRLLAKAKPDTANNIRRVLAKVASEIGATAAPRDYATALRNVQTVKDAGVFGENELATFAKAGQFAESVVALSMLCDVPLEIIDRLMAADRADPAVILCKSAGFGWPTLRAIITARPGKHGTSSQGLDEAYANFERLSPSTAKRIVHFWRARPGSGKG